MSQAGDEEIVRGHEQDLQRIVRALLVRFHRRPPAGYLEGKTQFRDAVMEMLDCSVLTAEQIVDHLESRGFLRFAGNPRWRGSEHQAWAITTTPIWYS